MGLKSSYDYISSRGGGSLTPDKLIDKSFNHNYNTNMSKYSYGACMKKSGFTLAEVAEPRHNNGFWSKGFTLAEVLITLGIIGIVAAVTIPTLVQNYQERAWKTSSEVFEAKLEEALKTMNTQQTLAGYKTTEDFVKELSNHFKMNKICNNDELLTCFSDKVYWGADAEEVDMSTIKTAKNFGQDKWNTDIVGVQFANGVTGLIAYNPECTQNPYSNQITGTSCLAILYDTDGFKNPNTSGKDLRSINVASLGSGCYAEVNGVCFASAPFESTPLTREECEAQKNELGINLCFWDNDYWAGAVKKCKEEGKRLPNQNELVQIASYIYSKDVSPSGQTSGTRDDDKASKLGFKVTSGSTFYVWSGQEDSSGRVYTREFSPSDTTWYSNFSSLSNFQAVCISD